VTVARAPETPRRPLWLPVLYARYVPDSEHPSGDDSREVDRRSGDESSSGERRARTSTAARPARTRPSADPRKDGTRTPPRRPTARPSVVDDDLDVAAQLANVPVATSVTDTPRGNGRSPKVAHTVLDPGLAVVADAEAVETAPVRGTSRSRRARQRSTAGAVAATTVDTETELATEDAVVEDAVVEDAVVEDAVVEDAVVEDAVVEAADLADDESVHDAALLDTEAISTVESQSALQTEVLPVVEDHSAPEGLVETEILPEVEPRIYDVETDEPGAYVSLVPAVSEPAVVPAHVEDEPETPVVVRRRRRRPRVRRVTRVIRHIDTWTVFKVVLLFNIVLYAATLISGVLLWNVAHGTGTVGNVERFMESFGWESFEFNGQEIFDNGWRIGMFVALGLTGLAVLAATTFNLITDIVGGIRVTVLEEEVVVAAPEMPKKASVDPTVEA
jgi:hypothetical protein